ncbi:MAG: NAD(P)-dependent oxidoreductase [candidate division WOR-3 bacterium]
MRIFVTGANGFIGSHVVEALTQKGYKVKAIVRKSANLEWLKDLPIELYYGNITELATVCEYLKDVDVILHIAGATKGKTYEDYYRVNVISTENLLTAITTNKLELKKFIYFSSIAAVGGVEPHGQITEAIRPQPVSWYGETKRKGEELVLQASDKFPVVILRLSAIYGPRDKEMLSYFKFLKYHLRPYWDGEVSLCYIKDLTCAVLATLDTELPSPAIYNISDGNCYTIDEISKTAERILGYTAIPVRVPKKVLELTAILINQLSREASIISPDKVKELKEPCWVCNIAKAQRELNFHPQYSLFRGLQETLNWYRKVHWL